MVKQSLKNAIDLNLTPTINSDNLDYEIGMDTDDWLYDMDVDVSIDSHEPASGIDYNSLRNRPQINSVLLEGNKTLEELGLRAIYYGTTAYWAEQSTLITEEGALYVYSDSSSTIIDGETVLIPSFKIGDGESLLRTTPFVVDADLNAQLLTHIDDTSVHITEEERTRWNKRTFVYEQAQASDVWEITHDLNKHPSVTVVDSAGTVVIGDIQYISNSRIIITFNGAFSGTAYLN